MAILGSIVCLGSALAFAVIAVLSVWATAQAIRQEVVYGFVSANPSPADRTLTLLMVGVPLAGVAALSLLSAVRFALVALGRG
ncbi:MAG: hypothetical protein HGA65_18445 [Oscillochloris sp.]|nr:hypothetical protein [Oscillochloris sp.]